MLISSAAFKEGTPFSYTNLFGLPLTAFPGGGLAVIRQLSVGRWRYDLAMPRHN